MPTHSSWTPRIESPASVRRFLAWMAVGSIALLVYASLIPLDYTPLSWDETRQQWRNIPWFDLQVFHRADWVANALVVLPSGVLASAAVSWGRPKWWPLLAAAPFISLLLAAVVIGIELAQVWFPTRTVSLNDIVAGVIGAAVAPILWILAGRHVERGITRFLTLPSFEDRLKWLCVGYLGFILIYTLLPLDFVVSYEEWQLRLATGNVRWNPFAGEFSAEYAVRGLTLSAVRMAPLGLLLALISRPRLAGWTLLLLPIAFELLQIPLFSKHATTIEVLGGWLGGSFGYFVGTSLHYFRRIVQRPVLWGLLWIVAYAATVAAFLLRHDQVLRDSTEIAQRFRDAWALPLVKYYSGSEYSAYTNVAAKIALFAVLGTFALGWQRTARSRTGIAVFWLTLTVVSITAFSIELLQVFLPPLVPDISDAFTYLFGYAAGYQIARILWGGTPSPHVGMAWVDAAFRGVL